MAKTDPPPSDEYSAKLPPGMSNRLMASLAPVPAGFTLAYPPSIPSSRVHELCAAAVDIPSAAKAAIANSFRTFPSKGCVGVLLKRHQARGFVQKCKPRRGISPKRAISSPFRASRLPARGLYCERVHKHPGPEIWTRGVRQC